MQGQLVAAPEALAKKAGPSFAPAVDHPDDPWANRLQPWQRSIAPPIAECVEMQTPNWDGHRQP